MFYPINRSQNILKPLVLIIVMAQLSLAQSVVYAENQNGNWDLFETRVDSKIKRRITTHPSRDFHSDFSPNSGKLVFDSYRTDETRNIFTLDAGSNEIIQLTFLETRDGHPIWSPDQTRIAFQSSRTGDSEVYVMNSDGTGVKRITDSPGYDGIPKWSPDGTKLAFNSSRDGNPEIYIYDFKTGEQTRVTKNNSADFIQGWSQFDDSLLFVSDRSGIGQLYLTNAEGHAPLLLQTRYPVTSARYGENGKWIVLVANSPKGNNVFLMRSDGTELNQLTDTASEKRFPVFLSSGFGGTENEH